MRTFELIVVASLAMGSLAASINRPVKTVGGLVSGVPGKNPSIMAFKGVPFAAPPVGDLRWRAPKQVAPWQGVRRADKFSASCIQHIVAERKPWTYEFMAHGDINEDCLYLNVWTGAKSASEKLPVFVYLYGGGFSEGSASVPVYDGEGLAKKGLVVVTINYRVGVLGFLADAELTSESVHRSSGNYGLLDQIAALQWVHDNIAGFGGDANRVTVAGQSAGGMSVHDLTASPLAKGLLQRAIIESGGSNIDRAGNSGTRTLAEAEADGQKFAQSKGAKSIAELRAMSWQELTESRAGGPAGPGLRFAPIVDGYSLPAPVGEIIAQGKQNDVVTLTGANTGELGGFGPSQGQPSQDVRDRALVSMYLWARERSKTAHTKVYEYLWDHTLPGPDAGRFGAFHSSEVPYVLNTLYMSDRPFTDADQKIAAMMSSYWANFAANGDPNGKGLAQWAPVDEKQEIMELGDKTGPIPVASSPAKFQFFEKLLTAPGPSPQEQVRWIEPGKGGTLPAELQFDDALGRLGVVNASGPVNTKGHPFFEPLGVNGRACVTCHQPAYAMTISAAAIRERWSATQGKDPLFAAIDGSNCPDLPQDKESSHSLLLNRGLIRLAIPWPPASSPKAGPQFSIEVVSDPTGCNTSASYGLHSAHPTVSVFRRPRMAANLKYVTNPNPQFALKLGGLADVDPETGKPVSMNFMADAREPSLRSQARNAGLQHGESHGPLADALVQRIVDFESQIYVAQIFDRGAGDLAEVGGPPALGPRAMEEHKPGVLGDNDYDPVFQLFDAWKHPATESAQSEFRASVARGNDIFMFRQFWLRDATHINSIGLGNPLKRTCATCHNAQMTGQDLAAGWVDLGTTNYPTWTEPPLYSESRELPVFKITCDKDAPPHPYLGRVIYTSDPGRALISGRCVDVGSIVMQQFRGLAARAPYFSNGSMKSLRELVDFYDRRFDMKMTELEKQDLANFLGVL